MAEPSPRSLPATGGLSSVGRHNSGNLRWPLLLSVFGHSLLLVGQLPWEGPQGARSSPGLPLTAALRGPAVLAAPVARSSQPVPVAARSVAGPRKAEGRASGLGRGVATPGKAGSSVQASHGDAPAELAEEPRSLYRLALARQLRGVRTYPESARAQGLAGVALLSLIADPASATLRVRLERSSGHSLLDEAALAMASRAVGRVPLPVELQGRRWQDVLAIHFNPAD